jgi:hypothetical protein
MADVRARRWSRVVRHGRREVGPQRPSQAQGAGSSRLLGLGEAEGGRALEAGASVQGGARAAGARAGRQSRGCRGMRGGGTTARVQGGRAAAGACTGGGAVGLEWSR